LSAEIIWLRDRRGEADADLAIDLRTAVDVAIRDLQEIEAHWGTELALERLAECRSMLRTVLEASRAARANKLVRELEQAFVVVDVTGQAVAYTYFRRDENTARQANVLTYDEARRIAANIAKLPELLSPKGEE
jgi:predicted RecB family endonuclease